MQIRISEGMNVSKTSHFYKDATYYLALLALYVVAEW